MAKQTVGYVVNGFMGPMKMMRGELYHAHSVTLFKSRDEARAAIKATISKRRTWLAANRRCSNAMTDHWSKERDFCIYRIVPQKKGL